MGRPNSGEGLDDDDVVRLVTHVVLHSWREEDARGGPGYYLYYYYFFVQDDDGRGDEVEVHRLRHLVDPDSTFPGGRNSQGLASP